MRKKAAKKSKLGSAAAAFAKTAGNDSYSFSFNNYLKTGSDGCGGLTVMIQDCGSWEPGSTPGRGPALFLFNEKKNCTKRKTESGVKKLLNKRKDNSVPALPGCSPCVVSDGGDARASVMQCRACF
jgi:hypothetical protein